MTIGVTVCRLRANNRPHVRSLEGVLGRAGTVTRSRFPLGLWECELAVTLRNRPFMGYGVHRPGQQGPDPGPALFRPGLDL